MNRFTDAPKAATGIGAIGVALAITGGLVLATPAFAAQEDGVFGATSVVMDFSTAGQLGVEITTQNLSGVPAYGAAYLYTPNGKRYDFGPSRYAPGESRTFAATLPGHPCVDLKAMSAAAFGFADLSDDTPEWTSGVMAYPDPRITVIGCHPTPTPTPTITPTPTPTPTITPTPTPTPTITPTPTPTPTITPTPTPTPTITPTPTTTAVPAGGSDGGSLAQTGTAIGGTLLLAAAGLMAVAAGLFIRGRQGRATQSK